MSVAENPEPPGAVWPGMSVADGMLFIAMNGRASSPVLVGRSEQMAALEGALSSVRQGGPAAVLLGGEAGVGKTRLIGEFGEAARLAGTRVLTGACMQLGVDGLPYAPFTAVVRDLVHEMGADAFAAMLPGRATRELARLLPELGEPENEADPATARARLFEELLSALEALARRSPLVLIIEDAHWADRSSRDLLTYLIGNQRWVKGLLIVVTYRSDELHRTHPLRPLLATLDRIEWVERLDVPRLARSHTEELARRIVGRELADDLEVALYRRSQGNPLFVEALVCCDGELSPDLPESLRDLLLDSVRRLPDDTQEVLRVLSASSGPAGHGLLAAVTGLDDDALTAALRPAAAANVLRAAGDGYQFRHELISEAVHEDLLPGEHGRLHSRFAEAIDANPALVPPGRAAIEMAHHWYWAHDATWALIAAWQAAAQAGRAVGPAERLDLLARVLELWDQVPDAAERIGADHVRVLEDAAAAAEDAVEYDRATAFTTAALRELDPATEPVRVARLLSSRGHASKHLGRLQRAKDFERALELVPAELDAAARAEILAEAAHCTERTTRDYAEEALALARQIGNKATEARALMTLAIFLADPGQQAGPGSEAIEMLARGRTLAESEAAFNLIRTAAVNESHLFEGAGHHELAVAAARRGVVSAQAQGLQRSTGALLAINQAEPLYALGRWDEATELITEALDLSPTQLHRVMLEVIKGQIALARGDLDVSAEATTAARSALRALAYEDQHQLPLAELEITLALAAEGPAAGLAAAAQVMDSWDLSGGSPRYAWPVVAAAAEAYLAAVRQVAVTRDEQLGSDAAVIADRLRTIAEKLEVFGSRQHAYQQTVEVALGATSDWDEAAAAWEAVSEPYPVARALLRAAETAVADGAREAATERLRRAATLAAELGARPLGEQIAALARRARLSVAEAAPAGEDISTGGLTERELEVLRLVAAGRTNREIAAELFISPKTASVHVSNILGKLGAASRTEAAAQAHARHLLT
jgi:DNA-binding CsgD family transcriptional regulator